MEPRTAQRALHDRWTPVMARRRWNAPSPIGHKHQRKTYQNEWNPPVRTPEHQCCAEAWLPQGTARSRPIVPASPSPLTRRIQCPRERDAMCPAPQMGSSAGAGQLCAGMDWKLEFAWDLGCLGGGKRACVRACREDGVQGSAPQRTVFCLVLSCAFCSGHGRDAARGLGRCGRPSRTTCRFLSCCCRTRRHALIYLTASRRVLAQTPLATYKIHNTQINRTHPCTD